jgi:hypothetical protein
MRFWKLRHTCELKACPKISSSFLAYISDLPVSVAYSTVALIRRESARPNSLDVNFTALNRRGTNEPLYQETQQGYKKKLTVYGIMVNTVIACLQDATQRREHVYRIFRFTALRNGSVNTFPLLGNRYLIMQQLHYNNGRAAFSMWPVLRYYKEETKSVHSVKSKTLTLT